MPVTLEQWQHSYPLQVLLSGQWLLLINFTEQPHEMTLPQGDWQIVAPFHHHSLSPIPPKTFVVMQRHRFLPSAY
nr:MULTISPECIES: hypothetical protein [Providencia]